MTKRARAVDTFTHLPDKPLPARPRWLDQEALPRRLLETFLTKLENNQRLSLRITPKTAPELYDFQNEDVKLLWALIKSLDNEFHLLSVKLVRTRPNQEPYEGAQLTFDGEKEELVRHWLNRPALDPYALDWEHTLSRMKAQFEDYGQALFENIVRVPDHSAEQTLKAFACIGKELRTPATLRTLSARCFWGDSKFLDRREEMVRAMFPSLAHHLVPRPILMAVHLPEVIENLLFVENQDTFLTLAHLDMPGYVLVYSAGFRGSATRIRDRGHATFSYLNPSRHIDVLERFENWWFNKHAEQGGTKPWFWGDLDFAGMAILKALRQTFPDTHAWKPGYLPLLDRLQAGWGHGHDASGKGLQSDPDCTGCTFADLTLLPLMRETYAFVDQEAIAMSDVTATF